MATIAAVILKTNIKADGTWNVNIRIWHKGKPAYIDTIHYVGKSQVGRKSKNSKTLVIKDDFILDRVAPDLKKYRDWISDHKELVNYSTAKELKQHLLNIDKTPQIDGIDFLGFCEQFISNMNNSTRASSAKPLTTVYNSLKDYFKTDAVSVTMINYNFLKDYEVYLKKERVLIRNKKGGGSIHQQKAGLSASGLHNHMRDLRLLFNEIRNHYNDEDAGIIRIAHYPFKKYKVGTPPITRHRDRPVSEIITIKNADLPAGSRAELARDLCMLSFYMLGMNAGDIYEMPQYNQIKDRYEYKRAKTRGKRKDEAFISIKIIDPVKPILKKYAGKLQLRYVNKAGLNKAIDEGLKILSKVTEIPNIDFYDVRHCVGTWARRQCGFSKDDVAEALNQTDRTVTDTYIAPDWTKIDEIQSAIVSLLTASPVSQSS